MNQKCKNISTQFQRSLGLVLEFFFVGTLEYTLARSELEFERCVFSS